MLAYPAGNLADALHGDGGKPDRLVDSATVIECPGEPSREPSRLPRGRTGEGRATWRSKVTAPYLAQQTQLPLADLLP